MSKRRKLKENYLTVNKTGTYPVRGSNGTNQHLK